MKKVILSLTITLVILALLTGVHGLRAIETVSAKTAESDKANLDVTVEEISEKLIRFHVIANSDREDDQALKLKVRDEVLKYIQPKLKDSKSIEQSREILKNEDKKILDIANEVIKANGYSYNTESTLSKEYFPVKTYGNITLPQGEYEAYRIIIGTGEGKNWWCVMFPPICFVDITKGEVAYEETEKEMKEVLDDKEFEAVNNRVREKNATNATSKEKANSNNSSKSVKNSSVSQMMKGNGSNKEVTGKEGLVDNTEDRNIVVKFKLGEILKSLFQ